jgi:hypothetical protein
MKKLPPDLLLSLPHAVFQDPLALEGPLLIIRDFHYAYLSKAVLASGNQKKAPA